MWTSGQTTSEALRAGFDGFLNVTDEQWQESIELNLFAAVRTCRAVLPLMLNAGHGSIVNICSVNAKLADPLVVDYGQRKPRSARPFEVTVEGVRWARHLCEHREPGSGRNGLVAWRQRCRRDRGPRHRGEPTGHNRFGRRQFCDGTLYAP